MFCTITTIDESPLKPGIIWAGTDDGKVHVTSDSGSHWDEITDNLIRSGAPGDMWVSRIVASSHKKNRTFVTKSGYREDVFKPYIYRTDDMGKTWKNISGNLPDSPISVIYEDKVNENLLFVGNDTGVFFTISGGDKWFPLKNNMPPVPVRDLLIHPRDKDLVVGTYGRGVWVTNISPLQEMNTELLKKKIYLFNIQSRPVQITSPRAWWGNYHMTGDAHIRTENEKGGLNIYFYASDTLKKPMELIVSDMEGKEINRKKIRSSGGIQKINWNSPSKKAGFYKFTIKSGKYKITKTGELKRGLIWPLYFPK
ncbi:MAG: hypothetical protein ABFR75_10795 [Acidobacteriota bacterium]